MVFSMIHKHRLCTSVVTQHVCVSFLSFHVERLHAIQFHYEPRPAASASLLHGAAALCANRREFAAVLPNAHLQQV